MQVFLAVVSLVAAVSASWMVGACLRVGGNRWARFVLGACGAFSAYLLLLTGAYLAHEMNVRVAAGAVAVVTFGAFVLWHRVGRKPEKTPRALGAAGSRRLLAAAVVTADLFFAAMLLSWRSGDPLQSPWTAVPVSAVALFLVTTWMCLLLLDDEWDGWSLAALTVHGLALFGVTELVYAYGFGFDPFIHRATEAHIAANGLILPRQPFYNGQYAVVVALHQLTGFSVNAIDRLLVPALAALTMPVFALKLGEWFGKARRGWWPLAFAVLPFLPLTFTTPSNLVVLMLMWVACLAPFVAASWPLQTLAWGIALAALATHPLVGIMVAALACAPRLVRRFGPVAAVLGGCVMALLPPALFALNNLRHGDPAFIGSGTMERLANFTDVFRSPFPVLMDGRVDAWSPLYAFAYALPWLLLALAVFGTVLAWRQKRTLLSWTAWPMVIGTVVAVFVLTTQVWVPGIIGWEQGEFSVRLIDACQRILMLLWIPALAVAVDRLSPPATVRRAAVLAGVAAIITASWYLTYPQANAHSTQVGWGVGEQHVAAVEFIKEDAGSRKYLVLSDQMVSVTALRQFGFENLPYAIPTGGRLYEYFLDMAHYRVTPEVMREAMAEFGAERGYFVINDYYGNVELYMQELAPFADGVYEVGDGRAVVLVFERVGE